MKRVLLLLIPVLGCTPSTPAGAPAPTADAAEVVAVAQRLFDGMEARDTAGLRALFLPQARVVSVVRQGEGTAVRDRSVGEFIAGVAAAQETLLERMWNPEVRIDGDLATLWTRYDFHRGAQFSHCGTDAFQLVRMGGRWLVVALSFTDQREGCPPAPAR